MPPDSAPNVRSSAPTAALGNLAVGGTAYFAVVLLKRLRKRELAGTLLATCVLTATLLLVGTVTFS